MLLSLVAASAAFTGTKWQLSLNIGQISGNAASSMLTQPLAMFTPGGGRPAQPAWFGENWVASGSRLIIPLEVAFDGELAGKVDEAPFKRTKPRVLSTPSSTSFVSMSGAVDVATVGVAWGAMEMTSIETLALWCVDLPGGACKGDVSLDPGTRLYFSTRVWKAEDMHRLREETLPSLQAEVQAERETEQRLRDGGPMALKERIEKRRALEERIEKLERGLPKKECPTVDVPATGPAAEWASGGEIAVAQEGQLSVRRVTQKLPNPFDLRPNMFGPVEEYGVVGSFKMTPAREQ